MTAFVAIPRDAAHRQQLLDGKRFSEAAFYLIGTPGQSMAQLVKEVPRTVTRILTPDGEWKPDAKPATVEPVPHDAPLDFCAVTCFFNPVGYQSLRRNYDRFAAGIADSGIPLVTVELAIGDQPHTIEPKEEKVIHVRGNDVMFSKENLLNIAFRHVPQRFSRIAFLDCDLRWNRPDWHQDAAKMLDTHGAVQLFNYICYLDRKGDVCHHGPSYTRKHQQKIGGWGAPGGGWLVSRDWLEWTGGLYEHCVVGAGDMIHTLMGFLGDIELPWQEQLSPQMREEARTWARRCHSFVRGQVACVDATVTHLWHGDRSDRQHTTRGRMLSQCDPATWMRHNDDGVLEWTDAAPDTIRQQLVDYFTARREDVS